jgi:DNA-binding MarR family transcriptional regulator
VLPQRRASRGGIEPQHDGSDNDPDFLCDREQFGLNQTDLLAMDLISREQGVTAGQLAEHIQLTTGAITGLIDRLERAGFARRAADRKDRRRVVVVATAKEERIATLYRPLATALRRAVEPYAEKDLALITEFLRQLRQVVAMSSESVRCRRS